MEGIAWPGWRANEGGKRNMDFFDVVKARYSYRGEFKDQPASEEDLRRIVQAGLDAPSGMNRQTTEFVIVTDRARVQALAGIVLRESIATATAVIVLVGNPDPGPKGVSFWVEDCSAAAENILLAAAALGYASCWIDGALRREGRAEKVALLLGVPPSRTVRILLPLGVPAEPGPRPEKKPFGERAWFNSYGGA